MSETQTIHLDASSYRQEIPRIEALFSRAFGGRVLPPGFLEWRYLQNPAGGVLAIIETDGTDIVSNYSASPCPMAWGERKFLSALSMTTMTDARFAGRGLFPKLASALYDQMARTGHDLIWGFPNHNSHQPITRKLAWFDVYEVPNMRLAPVGAISSLDDIRYDDRFELRYGPNPSTADLIHVVKDTARLQWRYASHPSNVYRNIVIAAGGAASSWCVVKSYEGGLDIVDFQAADPVEGQTLLRHVVQHATKENAAFINAWAPRHHFMHALCERAGFRNREPITYFGARVLTDALDPREVASFSNWFVQMGDSDVY